jgi:hypothetical protein
VELVGRDKLVAAFAGSALLVAAISQTSVVMAFVNAGQA